MQCAIATLPVVLEKYEATAYQLRHHNLPCPHLHFLHICYEAVFYHYFGNV